jgi:putative spermidine/putrescine transport system substrate-binding protein
MKSKWFVTVSLLIVASIALSACGGAGAGGGEESDAGPLQEVGEGEGALSIVAWAGYVERGETDPNFDWVTQFERETGCMVSVKTAATSDEMVALMNEGGFDLVTASGDASNRLISGGRVQEINIDLIPSYSAIDERLQNAPWHTVDGKHYGVPYSSGQNILMYNTDIFGDQPPDKLERGLRGNDPAGR